MAEAATTADPGCAFDPAEWTYDWEPIITGPVLRCLTHGMPAAGEVYELLYDDKPLIGVCYDPASGHRADYDPIAEREADRAAAAAHRADPAVAVPPPVTRAGAAGAAV